MFAAGYKNSSFFQIMFITSPNKTEKSIKMKDPEMSNDLFRLKPNNKRMYLK